jgi:hypothetical protein
MRRNTQVDKYRDYLREGLNMETTGLSFNDLKKQMEKYIANAPSMEEFGEPFEETVWEQVKEHTPDETDFRHKNILDKVKNLMGEII